MMSNKKNKYARTKRSQSRPKTKLKINQKNKRHKTKKNLKKLGTKVHVCICVSTYTRKKEEKIWTCKHQKGAIYVCEYKSEIKSTP